MTTQAVPSRLAGHIGWFVMAFLATGVAIVSARYLLDTAFVHANPVIEHHLSERPLAMYMHFGFGLAALAVGPYQFLSRVRTSMPTLHRWIGRFYVAFCLLGGIGGGLMAPHSVAGPVAVWGFGLLAIAWLYTTSMGYITARNRDFKNHRRWMVRSYALTYGAVMLRIYLPLSQVLQIDFMIAYPVIAWIGWVPNLMVVEWYMRRKA